MEKIARRNRSRAADRGEHAGDERRHAGDAPATRIRRPESDRIELRDARVRVLVLRLTAAGIASSSVCTGTRDGRQTRPTLGMWPAVVAADARKLAQAAISAMQAGGDSVTASQRDRAARVEHAGPTVNHRLTRWRAPTPAHWQETDSRDVAGFCRREIEPNLRVRILRATMRGDGPEFAAAKRQESAAAAFWCFTVAPSFEQHGNPDGVE